MHVTGSSHTIFYCLSRSISLWVCRLEIVFLLACPILTLLWNTAAITTAAIWTNRMATITTQYWRERERERKMLNKIMISNQRRVLMRKRITICASNYRSNLRVKVMWGKWRNASNWYRVCLACGRLGVRIPALADLSRLPLPNARCVNIKGPQNMILKTDVPCRIRCWCDRTLIGHKCKIQVKNCSLSSENGDVSISVKNSRKGRKSTIPTTKRGEEQYREFLVMGFVFQQ